MDDFKNILLDGEKVLWFAKPDPGLIKPLSPFWRRKLAHFVWIAITLLVVAFCLRLASAFPGMSVIFNAIAVVGIVGLIPASLLFLDFKDGETPHQFDAYAITDRRLIITNFETKSNTSIFPNQIGNVTNNMNDNHRTLSVHIGFGDDYRFLLHGLVDAEKVEKMIIERFSIKEEEK